jgi:hypothetical protein
MNKVMLLLAGAVTMACGPGEIERTLTEPGAISCPAVLVMKVVCGTIHDNKQECHMESQPVPCEKTTPTPIVICLPNGTLTEPTR